MLEVRRGRAHPQATPRRRAVGSTQQWKNRGTRNKTQKGREGRHSTTRLLNSAVRTPARQGCKARLQACGSDPIGFIIYSLAEAGDGTRGLHAAAFVCMETWALSLPPPRPTLPRPAWRSYRTTGPIQSHNSRASSEKLDEKHCVQRFKTLNKRVFARAT